MLAKKPNALYDGCDIFNPYKEYHFDAKTIATFTEPRNRTATVMLAILFPGKFVYGDPAYAMMSMYLQDPKKLRAHIEKFKNEN